MSKQVVRARSRVNGVIFTISYEDYLKDSNTFELVEEFKELKVEYKVNEEEEVVVSEDKIEDVGEWDSRKLRGYLKQNGVVFKGRKSDANMRKMIEELLIGSLL